MVTLRDIAETAGVSIGTVDRILHKRGRYSPETARRVHQIIEELGYRPNLMARRLSGSRSCRIGVLLPEPEQDSGYWSIPLSGIKRAEKELEPFGLTLEIRHFNRYEKQDSFIRAGRELLEKEPDGILVTPLQEKASLDFLQQVDSRIPVIFFDTDLPGGRRTGYIGQDSYRSGALGARLLSVLTGGKKAFRESGDSRMPGRAYLIISPDSENEHLQNRIRGFRENVPGETEILRVSVESDHNLERFHRQLERSIEFGESGKTRGIFVCDASAHFVADYLASGAIGASGDLPALLGYDLVKENRRWLKEGIIDFLLTQRPGEQGYQGVNRLFRKIFLDEEFPETEYTPIDIVTRENLNYLCEEEGEWK